MDDLEHESGSDETTPADPRSSGEESTASRAQPVHQPSVPSHVAAMIGATIGRFTIRRIIGSGGMGTVYEAIQDQPRRRVAIKMIKRGLTSRSAHRRFEFEAQLLARLRHPGIAQVYEAGTYDDGDGEVPYFAMEYISNAKPINEYADDHGLGTHDRLRLFRKVCDAIQHGHLKGIVHRDLKPGNILVDSHGQPRIIDFGVARATDSDMAMTTLQTDVGQLVGTLQYMSPEQVEADPSDIDARSDVYALGVLLYELLTDHLPYDVSRAAIHEAARMVREDEPTKLSTINRHLRGDVETITLKALAKDRDRRYQSARDLDRDIQRYLDGDAITARSPGAVDFLRRFARKHRAAAISIVTIFGVLVIAVVAVSYLAIEASRQRNLAIEARDRAAEQSVIAKTERDRASTQARIAEAERDRATEQEQRARAVQIFTKNMLSAVNPDAPGITHDEQMKNVLGEASKSVATEFRDQPLVEAELRSMIGRNYQGMGLYREAEPHLVRSLELYRGVYGEDRTETIMAISGLGALRWQQADYDQAESLWKQALDGNRRLHGDFDPRTLTSIDHMGSIMLSLGRFDESEAYYREALAGRAHAEGMDAESTLASIGNLGLLLLYQEELEEAEFQLRRALEGRRRTLGEDHPKTLWSINSVGVLLRRQGRMEEAIPFLQEAADGHRRVLGGEHPSTLDAMNNLANALSGAGVVDEAQPIYEETLRIRTDVLGPDHPETIKTRTNLAALFLNSQRPAEAEVELAEVAAAYERLHGEDHPAVREALANHGEVLADLGRYPEARRQLERAISGMPLDDRLDEQNRITVGTLADVHEKLGDPAAARPLRDALERSGTARP